MENHETLQYAGQQILYRVFAFMAGAISLSGFTAILFAQRPDLLMRSSFILPLLLIAQLVVVMVLSWRISALSYTTAQALFVGYALLMGATLSLIFQVYTTVSIIQVFFITAGMFGFMALYGAYTRTDLSQYRTLLFMTLVGLIIAGVVNFFLRSPMVDMVTAAIGVLLFSALTAFDIQNIKRLAAVLYARNEDINKIALIGALQLYLDFINLFLSLLRLFGKQRES